MGRGYVQVSLKICVNLALLLQLLEIETVTPNTKRFRFALPEDHNVSGLKIACMWWLPLLLR